MHLSITCKCIWGARRISPLTHLTPLTPYTITTSCYLEFLCRVTLLGRIETASLSKISPSPQKEESTDVSQQTKQTRAVPRARVSVYMETLKHLSSDYELINANACAASASAQCESSTQTFSVRRDARTRKTRKAEGGKKREKKKQQCLFEQWLPRLFIIGLSSRWDIYPWQEIPPNAVDLQAHKTKRGAAVEGGYHYDFLRRTFVGIALSLF